MHCDIDTQHYSCTKVLVTTYSLWGTRQLPPSKVFRPARGFEQWGSEISETVQRSWLWSHGWFPRSRCVVHRPSPSWTLSPRLEESPTGRHRSPPDHPLHSSADERMAINDVFVSHLLRFKIIIMFTLLWPPYVIRQTIIFLPCCFYLSIYMYLSFFLLSSFFLAYSQRSQSGCLPYFYTMSWCGLSANLECGSETCCTRLAGNTGRKNDAKNRHLGTTPSHKLSGWIFATKACVDNRKKTVKQQCLLHTFPQCGELRPTSGWDRFGSLRHPSKFQRISRLGSVTAQHSSSGRQPNFAALNRGRHLYSAGRPSRWALAHILV